MPSSVRERARSGVWRAGSAAASSPAELDRFDAGGEALVVGPEPPQADAEVGEGAGEVGGVAGRVGGGEFPVQPHGVAARGEARRVRPDLAQARAEHA